jgi:threonine/homoserine/homoserine lactone efflux protein
MGTEKGNKDAEKRWDGFLTNIMNVVYVLIFLGFNVYLLETAKVPGAGYWAGIIFVQLLVLSGLLK